jgi:excisionase family DNA binding protein
LWSLLVFSGYLRAERGPVVPGKPRSPLRRSIPNEEVFEVYRRTFQSWMEKGLRGEGGGVEALLDALLKGDARRLEGELQRLATHMLSFLDQGHRDPERFYHGLMLGLLASLEPDYEVRSNRESGGGRPDVWVKPRTAGKPSSSGCRRRPWTRGWRTRRDPSGSRGPSMKIHREILGAAQRRVLGVLGPRVTAHGFYLGGGTALALRLGHRRSVDFDWFSDARFPDPVRLAAELQQEGVLLNVSERYVVGLLEGGTLPFHDVGAHRRVKLGDLLAFKRVRDAERAAALREMAEEAQRLGLGT